VEKIKVLWKPRAISHLKKQATWYAENMGISAANKFWDGLVAAGDLLAANPNLGKIEPILNDSEHCYRSLILHKDYKIIYFIDNERQIQIVSIWHCPKNTSTL